MGNFTEERCIVAMAEMHPYTSTEISDVFERCRSIDKTIDIIFMARQLRIPLMDVCIDMGF